MRSALWFIKPRMLAALLATFLTSGALGASDGPRALRLGLLPHLSPKLLIETYQPLVDYLQQALGRPVTVRTAPDFEAYAERAARGRYDIYLTAPHMAALAARRDGHTPLARFARQLHGVIVVAQDASDRHLSDLRGKTIATPDRLAIITLLGESALAEQEPHFLHTPSHNSAMLAVSEGRADAAVVGVSAYERIGPAVRNRLRVIAHTASVPHMMFMGAPQMAEQSAVVRGRLLAFNTSGDGSRFFAGPGRPFGHLVGVSQEDLEALRPIVDHLIARTSE